MTDSESQDDLTGYGSTPTERSASPLTVYRVAARLTQRELAEIAGVSPATVYNAETGRHRPFPSTAQALAAALRCPVADLFPPEESA